MAARTGVSSLRAAARHVADGALPERSTKESGHNCENTDEEGIEGLRMNVGYICVRVVKLGRCGGFLHLSLAQNLSLVPRRTLKYSSKNPKVPLQDIARTAQSECNK